ncbi:MAG: hypothetical protein GYA41_02045 [Bacteroidales bacterium]|nr:hypothetical protein [Bacteroidales bacterium]
MKKLLTVIFLLFNLSVFGATYYVATDGSDYNPGTISQPFATWQKAFSVLNAGDIAYIRGGTYYPTGTRVWNVYAGAGIIEKSGTSSNPIRVFAYPGEVPILDCRYITPDAERGGVSIYNSSYWHLKGLTVRRVDQNSTPHGGFGFDFVSCNNLIVEQCVSYDNGGSGFRLVNESEDNLILNCDSYNNYDYYTGGVHSDGIEISFITDRYPKRTNTIRGCRVWNNSDDCYDFYDNNGFLNIESCWAWHNGFDKGGSTPTGDGNGFKLGTPSGWTSTSPQRIMTNCLAWDNQAGGITMEQMNGALCALYNNICYRNQVGGGWQAGIQGWSSENLRHVLRNNISWANINADISQFGSYYTNDHNSWNSGVTVTSSDFLSLDPSGANGSRQSDGSLPYIEFLRLAPGSDLIDAGVYVDLDYEGNGPDIGAFESGMSSGTLDSPVFSGAQIQNGSPSVIELSYNISLANIIPSLSSYTVLVNSSQRSVNSIAISGSRVYLTLSSPVIYSDRLTVAYSKPASNPVQTPAGGEADSFSATNVSNNVYPPSPVYVSSEIENSSPSRLDISFNLTLANIIPSTSTFTVRVNSDTRDVSSISVSGTTVSLALSSPVSYGDAVTVSYSWPSSNALQSQQGGQVASFGAQSVTNNVTAPQPVYQSSSIENATPSRLDITYNMSLANSVPASSAFSVMVNSSARTVNSVTISGSRVTLTLSSSVSYGDEVTVAYTRPSSSPLQSASGVQAASFSAQSVLNKVGAPAPVYTSSSVENSAPARIVINFNYTLAGIVPAASAFTVTVNSVSRPVSSLSISGSTVILNLSSQVAYGNDITVAYTKPSSNPIQTPEGGQAASFSAKTVKNNLLPPVPAFVSSSIEIATPSKIDITYSVALANVVPSASAFSVMVNSAARSVTSVAISGTKVTLTLSSSVVYGDVVTVEYKKPSANPLQTTAGAQAASSGVKNVTNKLGAPSPVLSRATVENASPAKLVLTFNLNLAGITPPASTFVVKVNNTARAVSSLAISGNKVTLTLAKAVSYGDVVTVAYTKPSSNPLQSSAGGPVASFAAVQVSNKVLPPTPVYVSSAIENASPSRIDITYSLALANIVPSTSAFSVTVNKVAVTVTNITISGSKVLITLASAVKSGDAVVFSYTKPSVNPLQTAAGGAAETISSKTVTNHVGDTNSPPVIVIDYKSNSYSGFVSELDASESYDPNKDNLTYTWTVPGNIPVSTTKGSKIQYLSPIVNESMNVVFTLTVSDGKTSKTSSIPVEILPYKPELEIAEVISVEASSYQAPNYPYNILDGNIATMWSVNGDDEYIVLELKEKFSVQHVKLAFHSGQKKESYFDILGSNDKENWEPVLTKSNSCAFSGDVQVFDFPPSKTGKEFKYIKLVGHCNSSDTWNYISEFKIFGYRHRNPSSYENQIVKIFPNPASEYINIKIEETNISPDFIRIISMTGKILHEERLDPDIHEYTMPINLMKGIYLIQMGEGKITLFSQKLVVNP